MPGFYFMNIGMALIGEGQPKLQYVPLSKILKST